MTRLGAHDGLSRFSPGTADSGPGEKNGRIRGLACESRERKDPISEAEARGRLVSDRCLRRAFAKTRAFSPRAAVCRRGQLDRSFLALSKPREELKC